MKLSYISPVRKQCLFKTKQTKPASREKCAYSAVRRSKGFSLWLTITAFNNLTQIERRSL
jgi:hypothetical protein